MRVLAESLSLSWRVSSTAAEVIVDWPRAFEAVLDKCRLEAQGTSFEGRLGDTFGDLYRLICRRRGPEFAPVRMAFEQYLEENWRGALGKRNTLLGADVLDRARWQPAAQVARRLGVKTSTAIKRLEQTGATLSTRESPRGRMFVVARSDTASLVSAEQRKSLTLAEAAALLGLPKRRVRELAGIGLVQAERTGGFNSTWSFSRESVARIIDVRTNLPVVTACPDNALSIGHVLRHWACSSTAARALIVALVEQRLRPVGALSSRPGLGGLLVELEKLREISSQLVEKSLSGAQTVPAAAAELKIKQEVAYHLVRRGLLEATKVRPSTSRTQALVSSAAISEFRARYRFGRDLALLCGCSPKALVAALETWGLRPVAGPRIDGCRQAVFLNDDSLARAMQKVLAERDHGCVPQ
jgi:hypothetical protein